MATTNSNKIIAVVGATGQQGGRVVRALQAGSQFAVHRAYARRAEVVLPPLEEFEKKARQTQ